MIENSRGEAGGKLLIRLCDVMNILPLFNLARHRFVHQSCGGSNSLWSRQQCVLLDLNVQSQRREAIGLCMRKAAASICAPKSQLARKETNTTDKASKMS